MVHRLIEIGQWPRGCDWLRLAAISVVGTALIVAIHELPSRDEFSPVIPQQMSLGADDEGYHPRQVLEEPLPPITDAPTIPADEAQRVLNPEELVLGVAIDGESRAYPINMLTGPRREIINDTLGRRAIAATW